MVHLFDDASLNEICCSNDYHSNDYQNITGHSLTSKTYSIRDIIFLIENASVPLLTFLYNQKLSAYVCAKYILDDKYAVSDLDYYITMDDVLSLQKHLTEDEIKKQIDLLNHDDGYDAS